MVYLLLLAPLVMMSDPGRIIQGPKNTAAERGERVELTCEAEKGTDFLEWRYFRSGVTGGERIWFSETGLVDKQFEVRNEGNFYRLIIPALSEGFNHLYECKLLHADESRKAEVIMVEKFGCSPSWPPPPLPPAPPLAVVGQAMMFSCEVAYLGALTPSLVWYRDSYKLDTHTTIAGNVITATANQTAAAELDEAVFECRLTFEFVQGGSNSPPEYTDACETYYQVEHAPTNIRVYPQPEYEGHVIAIQIGNVINCTASGRPEPKIYWYERDTYETQQGAELEITPSRAGEHTWVCKAENEVLGNPRYAEYAVSYSASGYATDSPYGPDPPKSAKVQPWVIAISVVIPLLVVALVLVIVFVKKRRTGKDKGEKKDGAPGDATEVSANDPLMQQPVPKPRSQSLNSQDSGVVTPTHGQAAMYPTGSQGRIYKPPAQTSRQQSQPQYGEPGPQMYRPPSQDQLNRSGPNLQMVRRGSQDHLDQRHPGSPMYGPNPGAPMSGAPNLGGPMYGAPMSGAPNLGGPMYAAPMHRPQSREQLDRNPYPMHRTPSQDALNPRSPMYRTPSQDALNPRPPMQRTPSQDALNPRSPMYRSPSQDALNPNGPQPAPRTKLSKSKENLAMQEPQPRPRSRGSRSSRGSMDQPLSGHGHPYDPSSLRKSRENLGPDGRPRTLPKPAKSREDLSRKSQEDLSRSMDEDQKSRPPTLPKPTMQQKLGVQVLPPPPKRHQSVDTEV